MSAFDSLDAGVDWLEGTPLPAHDQRERFVDESEPALLALAHACEQATPWRHRRPHLAPLSA